MPENVSGRFFVPLGSIYVPPDDDARIREPENTQAAVTRRQNSILRLSQLQPILVQELDRKAHPDAPEDRIWKLIDGQIRWLSMMALSARYQMGETEVIEAFDRWGMRQGFIEATTRETIDPIDALMMEFHANEDRDDFSWEEKGRYIRRIHEMLVNRYGRKEWTKTKTASFTEQSEATVTHYLQLTDDSDPATQDERVRTATTKNAAVKQLKIVREQHRRIEQVKRQQERELKVSQPKNDHVEAARLSIYHGDAREWIKLIPDGSLAWFHWDPPYGGKEGKGGAFASHKGAETDAKYCLDLMRHMFREIWRVLQDGAWFVVWYTPVHYNWLRLTLQGHCFSETSGFCQYCEKHILRDYIWLSENYSCRKSPHRFWVNPYPNYWRKTDRAADGHEIQRFLTKETEPFLLAGKNADRNPILLRSDRGNVFDYPNVSREERRHANHKPPELLSEILSLISVPGDLGGDAGSGSGSIIEAAYGSNRKVVVAELDETHHQTSLAVALDVLKGKNYGPSTVADWLPVNFT